MARLHGDAYEPTPDAAQARLDAVDPAAYARTRNHLDGAVTGLGPYLTHGFLTLPQVRDHLAERHRLYAEHKLIFELAWREYFRHVWAHEGDGEGEGILASLHGGPLPEAAYARELPADLCAARTGVPAIDAAVRQLYLTGTLHNHARMWLASYTVHLRKVHWRAGADWMLAHLLDGDLASNHLSWQWVAGTGSVKPYLFNAENVARYAPKAWHSEGTAVDRSYDELDRIARTPGGLAEADAPQDLLGGLDEPPRFAAPPPRWSAAFTAPDPAAVAGRDVWLMHPWHLAEPPNLANGERPLVLALLDLDVHGRWPWSERRWDFVAARLVQAVPTPALRWAAPGRDLVAALGAARSVHGVDDPHLAPALRALPLTPPPRLLPEPPRRCGSFSAFWNAVGPRSRAGRAAAQLPGRSPARSPVRTN
jgi:deoxyribodipyrimidine photo-lyase